MDPRHWYYWIQVQARYKYHEIKVLTFGWVKGLLSRFPMCRPGSYHTYCHARVFTHLLHASSQASWKFTTWMFLPLVHAILIMLVDTTQHRVHKWINEFKLYVVGLNDRQFITLVFRWRSEFCYHYRRSLIYIILGLYIYICLDSEIFFSQHFGGKGLDCFFFGIVLWPKPYVRHYIQYATAQAPSAFTP